MHEMWPRPLVFVDLSHCIIYFLWINHNNHMLSLGRSSWHLLLSTCIRADKMRPEPFEALLVQQYDEEEEDCSMMMWCACSAWEARPKYCNSSLCRLNSCALQLRRLLDADIPWIGAVAASRNGNGDAWHISGKMMMMLLRCVVRLISETRPMEPGRILSRRLCQSTVKCVSQDRLAPLPTSLRLRPRTYAADYTSLLLPLIWSRLCVPGPLLTQDAWSGK